jgi:hypothetical protein
MKDYYKKDFLENIVPKCYSVAEVLTLGTYNVYWANGVIPIINSGDLCELSLLRIGSDIKAVLTSFKTA